MRIDIRLHLMAKSAPQRASNVSDPGVKFRLSESVVGVEDGWSERSARGRNFGRSGGKGRCCVRMDVPSFPHGENWVRFEG
jgi:hypothetical protein